MTRVQAGGWAGVLAAVMLIINTVLSQIAPVGMVYRSPSDYAHQVLLLVAYLLVMVAVIGLRARHRGQPRYGLLGGLGSALTMIGYSTVAAVIVAGMIAGSRILQEVRIGAAVVLLVGSALLGIAVLRARLLPWWCGVLLIVAFPLGDVANQVFAGAEGILLAALWGSVGAALLSRADGSAASAAEQPQSNTRLPS